MKTKNKRIIGFTLVELLVVISIIALLLSILMPSLSKVRMQAKSTICKSNVKSVGSLTSLYQADNNGYVPLLYTKYGKLPKWSLLSLALAKYSDARALPPEMDPTYQWDSSQFINGGPTYSKYTENYLPKIFICPYAAGKKGEFKREIAGTVNVDGKTYNNEIRKGVDESYTAFWGDSKAGLNMNGQMTRNGIGVRKYATLVWFNYNDMSTRSDLINGNRYGLMSRAKSVRWESSMKAIGGSTANTTVLYCDRGEHMVSYGVDNIWFVNYGSHPKGSSGGTNVLFADFHVGSVEGTQVGGI